MRRRTGDRAFCGSAPSPEWRPAWRDTRIAPCAAWAAWELSWRVSLLPFIEQQGLFTQFDPGSAWDSPLNRGSHCAKGASVRELVHGDRRLTSVAQLGHEPHRLGGDVPGHLALATLAVAKDDWHLDDAKAGAYRAIGELDLEGVALRAHAIEVDRLQDLAAKALEASGEIANLQPQDNARVGGAALAHCNPQVANAICTARSALRPVLDGDPDPSRQP